MGIHINASGLHAPTHMLSLPLFTAPCRVSKFNGVWALDLVLKGVIGSRRDEDAQQEVHFIGLKGEHSERKRQAVEAVYEARPIPSDHKVDGLHQGAHWGPSS